MDMPHEWLAELEMEDPGFLSYDNMNILSEAVDNLGTDSFSSEDYTEKMTCIDYTFQTQQTEINHHRYQEKSSSINKSSPTISDPLIVTTLPLSKTVTITFGNLNTKEETLQFHDSLGYEAADPAKFPIICRNPIQAHDHVLAERKRREKLNQNFISLSNVLPNLKKMDKASMLEEASNFIKKLQGRVKELEGSSDNKRKDFQESVISLKRTKLNTSDDEYYLSDETTNIGHSTRPCITSPEVEVAILGRSVLVSIQCQKKFSSLIKALTHMQKLGLSIISSNAMPFANTILLITIVVEIKDDFCMTTAELVKNLQLAMNLAIVQEEEI